MAHFLNKEIRATNVNTATSAIKCSVALATGLKKSFGPYVKEVIEAVLLKFKEKRPAVQEQCTKFCEAATLCCTLEDVRD